MPAEGDNLDMNALLQQASAMKDQLMSSQQQLDDERVEGTAGGGLVRATVSGTGELVALDIDPQACDPSDTETLADLVIAAVRDATTSAQQRATERMGDMLGGLGGPLAGMTGMQDPGREGSGHAGTELPSSGPALGFQPPERPHSDDDRPDSDRPDNDQRA